MSDLKKIRFSSFLFKYFQETGGKPYAPWNYLEAYHL